MRYVLKNQEMQTVDHETIHGIGIPGLVLMERASKAVADKAAQIVDHSQRILIISGIGNNGGDALACTRILLEQDYLVDYMIVGNIEKASADLKLQLQILKNLGYFPIDCEDVNFHEYDLAELYVKKHEKIGEKGFRIKKYKAIILQGKKNDVEALKWYRAAFEDNSTDELVIDSLITLSLMNKRKVSKEVLNAAIAVFVSHCERLTKIIMLIGAKIKGNIIDFYTNICYTMVSTFKEDCLCIERLWASWKRGKIAFTASPLFYRAQDRSERPIPFWSSGVLTMKMWHTSTLKPI